MIHYMNSTIGVKEKAELEVAQIRLVAQATEQEKQQAKLDYIAMMAEIDLADIEPDEDGEGGFDE